MRSSVTTLVCAQAHGLTIIDTEAMFKAPGARWAGFALLGSGGRIVQ